MRINNYNDGSNFGISFTGLTKKMKKQTYIDGQRDIKEIVNARGDKSLMVGALPGFIINKLPKENRKEAIMDIYSVFDQVAVELRDFDETKAATIDEITNRRQKTTVEKLEKVLAKYKIISKWDDFDIKYLGKGGKGAGYKLEGLRDTTNIDEDEFVIKVFHILRGKNWQNYKSHGCYAEINSAQYWMENVGKDTNRGKFFFGSLKSGYMVNKYVDDDVRLPKRVINPYNYGLKCTDESIEHKHNVCKGYSFDWGGVRVVNRVKNSNKYARKIYNIIKEVPELYREAKWWQLFNNKNISSSENKMTGLALSIKHLSNKSDYIDTCISLNKVKVNQALAYVLKYLPYKDAIKYFEKLVQTKDAVTQIILFNEIPLLAMKHRDEAVKDDLQVMRSEILPARISKYYDVAEKYALPESIEHLASFVHLVPRDKFASYYRRLTSIDNEALHDRLIYKLSILERSKAYFARVRIAKIVKNEKLKKFLLSSSEMLSKPQFNQIKNILYNSAKQAKL